MSAPRAAWLNVIGTWQIRCCPSRRNSEWSWTRITHSRSPRGDLECVIRVQDHSLFRREGQHLICQVPITFSQAALGADIEIPSLEGPLNHPLKPGTQSGD